MCDVRPHLALLQAFEKEMQALQQAMQADRDNRMCDGRSQKSDETMNQAVWDHLHPCFPSPRDREKDAKNAGENLARLVERQLGYDEGHIDPIALRLFIRAYWTRVSSYAHAIHGEQTAVEERT